MPFSAGRPFIATALIAATAISATWGMAWAESLDEGACAQLQSEQAQLVKAGVKDSMARGPDWAGAGASLMRLKEIERLIEVEEQLMFRCPPPKPVKEAAEAGSSDRKPKAAAVPAPVRKPKVNDAYVPPPKTKPVSGTKQ